MEHGAAPADGKTDLEETAPPSWKMAERGQCTYVRYVHFHSDTRNTHHKDYNDFGLSILSIFVLLSSITFKFS